MTEVKLSGVDQKVVVAWSSNGELMNMGFAEIGIIGDVHMVIPIAVWYEGLRI